jgi:hypothetical protein
MPTKKQVRANRIEYWLRLGPIGNFDNRQAFRDERFTRKCICGLTYTKYNWVIRYRVILGDALLGAVLAVILVYADWRALGIYLGVWAMMTIVFLCIGHSLTCSLRRPCVIAGEALGTPQVGG